MTTPTIPAGNLYMNATLYTGNGSTQTITNGASGASFQPDLVWIKSRSAATDNKLTDSVRGVTKALISNTTAAETTDTNGLTAFGTNGFTLGTDTNYNTSAATYVGWQWKAGGTAVSNTSGTITSSVSANTTSGFSIVTYTGTGANATVGHGLSVAPAMIIVKTRNSTEIWCTYTSTTGAGNYLNLQSTIASTSNTTVWNNTAPTSTVFSIGTSSATGAAQAYVAYCWTPIAGYSAFGSYTGNGSADGPFVYTGFRPRFVMMKASSSTGNWTIIDTSRDTYNYTQYGLYPNLSNAESNPGVMDILSNGLKIRSTFTDVNGSGTTYIYAAFAENPFKYALAR